MANYGKGDTSWFSHDRFGMFIHWGLYSMPARNEWIRHIEFMTDERYQIYFDLFNPDMFEPRIWAKAAKEAGMKYFVITTKHHEGFCLWDSKYTDYKATNTPAGRDLLREAVDAFRAEGIRVGFYYSLIDWHHPDFIIDTGIGPYRNLPEKERKKMNKGRDMKRYAKYMRDQVTELLTEYGKIDIMWFDFSYPAPDPADAEKGKGSVQWESEKMIKLVRKLQPDIIVDNRLDLAGSGDIVTPEQYTPDAEMLDEKGKGLVWEGCQTFSGSWGYHRDEASWKSAAQCVEMLVNHVSRNGNLLMNVGPTSRGCLDSRAMERLGDYAEWMKYNNRSIYGCGKAPKEYSEPCNCRYTYNAEKGILYLHLFAWPFRHVVLPGLAGKIRYAQILKDGSEIFHIENQKTGPCNEGCSEHDVMLNLPVLKPDSVVPVIEIFLKKPL